MLFLQVLRFSLVSVTLPMLRTHLYSNTNAYYVDKWAKPVYLFIFNYALQPFKVYCAIWVRRSNFRHQASPHVSPCESTQRRKVELWVRNVREFCLNADFHVTFRDLLHAVKLRHGIDGFTSPPKEGVLRIFFALKIRRLRTGVNPRT
jgi:hypothetical protein